MCAFELISFNISSCVSFSFLFISELNKNPVEGFSAGLIDDNDLYRWEVLIIGPPDTLYEGGVFKAHLTFPKDYPLRPPKMKFITEIWHPNAMLVELAMDLVKITNSVTSKAPPDHDTASSMLDSGNYTCRTHALTNTRQFDPNISNFDSSKEWREDRNGEFKRKVARCVRKSQETAFE
ncbi:UB2G1 enzyme, partial [Polyodon spathula]|nr:UB2G1 enzyme [Polyodon spathula]